MDSHTDRCSSFSQTASTGDICGNWGFVLIVRFSFLFYVCIIALKGVVDFVVVGCSVVAVFICGGVRGLWVAVSFEWQTGS